ncbi:hypothetical protein C6P45_004062 [Maudiozyma exigua]|uniref:RING-type domain-containing protein n=1 Tax=Maudiozyma exigua TaxID=34358 RepID=A0A9P7BBF2_MAUEX|nr:hypothetical protein C6P45_004062 [Kazachstania exigua]
MSTVISGGGSSDLPGNNNNSNTNNVSSDISNDIPNERKRRRSSDSDTSELERSNRGTNPRATLFEGSNDNDNDNDENDTASNQSTTSLSILETRQNNEADADFDLNNAFNQESPSASTNEGASATINSTTETVIGTTAERADPETINLETQNIDATGNSLQSGTAITNDVSNDSDQDDIMISGVNQAPEPIDLEASQQQVVDISDEELEKEIEKRPPSEFKAATEYKCPICFEPPETALITACGHVFCCDCLFHMVNSSRTNRSSGHCALCRSNVKFSEVRLVIMRKRRIKKS